MKAVILAGGFGTRISEESHLRPKPMIEIGGMPILWHIMKGISHYGIHDFIICAGYKQEIIKKWFSDYFIHCSDVTFDFATHETIIHNNRVEPWRVSIIDTGLHTMTGGRIKRVAGLLGQEPFLMTYGDGVSDVDISKLIAFHNKHGYKATLTGVVPEGRFGVMDIQGDSIKSFREKNKEDSGWINGGFMILEVSVLDYIQGDSVVFERGPLESLAAENQLGCFKHEGFWQCMDTLRDKEKLEALWENGCAPWKKWDY